MFSTRFQAALLLVLVSVSLSAALKCYNCQYIAGETNSDCKDNLRDDFLYDVRSSPSTKEATELGQIFNVTSTKGADDAKQSSVPFPLCQKFTTTVRGKEAISRTGAYGPASWAGTCDTSRSTLCWCNTDRCNGEGDNGEGDNGDGGNGATAAALNVALVIVAASFTLFKLHA